MTSPHDTLQGYFDELLVIPEATEEAKAAFTADAPQAKPVEDHLPKADERVLKPQKEIAKKPRALDLEPQEQHQAREKLAKLLSSTPPKPAPPKPAPVKAEASKAAPSAQVASKVQDAQARTIAVEVAKPVTESEIEEVTAQEVSAEQQLESGLSWAENGRPQWAQERFEVLLFEVAGLTLAVPLISLGQIQPLTDELTPLFGQADWLMGLLPTSGGKIRTINTAKFVMPERYQEAFLEAARYVVSINGLPWGLAVDAVNQPITLEPDDVKWRSERGKRPWLAGTVKEHMCALLDVATMGELLNEADKSASKADPLTDNL
ncbi:MAG: chemotaxis protein CheW [Cellvibrionaceae bacterium]